MLDLTPDMLLGKPTIHIPFNLIAQNMGDGKVIGVFQTTAGSPLLWNSSKTHQLWIADAFIRPHLVFESDQFLGCGLNGLATDAFVSPDKWVDGLLFDRRNQ
jgi:hypothetical protein